MTHSMAGLQEIRVVLTAPNVKMCGKRPREAEGFMGDDTWIKKYIGREGVTSSSKKSEVITIRDKRAKLLLEKAGSV